MMKRRMTYKIRVKGEGDILCEKARNVMIRDEKGKREGETYPTRREVVDIDKWNKHHRGHL